MRDGDEHAHLLTRRQILRSAAGLGLAAVTGTLLPGCGWGGGEDDGGSGPEPDAPLETTTIRLFSLPPANCIAPQYVAEPFLREEGFSEVQYPRLTPKDSIQRVSAGDVDFGVHYMSLLALHVADGAPIVMLGGIHLGCWQMVATGDIRSMRGFKGKTVSVISPDFNDGLFMAMTLANVGLDLRKDVKVVNHPPTEYARLLSSGEVDAVLAIPPVSTDLQAKGIGRIIINSIVDPPWSDYYCCGAFANRHWMEKHPVAAKRALRAVLKGADAVKKDPEAAARFVVDRGHTNNYDYTCDLLKEMPYDAWRHYDSVDSVRFYSLRLKEAGILETTPEEIIKRGTDFRYLSQLKRELQEA